MRTFLRFQINLSSWKRQVPQNEKIESFSSVGKIIIKIGSIGCLCLHRMMVNTFLYFDIFRIISLKYFHQSTEILSPKIYTYIFHKHHFSRWIIFFFEGYSLINFPNWTIQIHVFLTNYTFPTFPLKVVPLIWSWQTYFYETVAN